MTDAKSTEQRKQPPAPTDPRVGLNPTGRPRRSSAPRRQGGVA